jgi:hypothetical protein
MVEDYVKYNSKIDIKLLFDVCLCLIVAIQLFFDSLFYYQNPVWERRY